MRAIRWLVMPLVRMSARVGHAVKSNVRRVEDLWRQYGPFIGVGVLLVLFIAVCFFRSIAIFVNAGEAGVRFWRFYGTEIDRVYGEGIHIIPPWDRMEIYSVRVQATEHTARLLTSNGLEMKFSLSIRHHPEYKMLGLLHQRIGHDYVQKVVIPEIDEVLRKYVGRYTAEEVYTTKRGVLERIFSEAIENVEQAYVLVDRVLIRSIELPATIQRAVEAKLEQKQVAETYEYLLLKEQSEAMRKQIEAVGQRTYNEILSASLTENLLRWKGIEATRDLAKSENAKVIVIGNGHDGLPVILGAPGK